MSGAAGGSGSTEEEWLAKLKPWQKLVEHQGIAPCNPAWKVLADGHQRVSLNTYARKKWNPVLELHQPLLLCRPPAELIG